MSQIERYAFENQTLPYLVYDDGEGTFLTLKEALEGSDLESALETYELFVQQHPEELKLREFGMYYSMIVGEEQSPEMLPFFQLGIADFMFNNRVRLQLNSGTSPTTIDSDLKNDGPDFVRDYNRKVKDFLQTFGKQKKKRDLLDALEGNLVQTEKQIIRMFITYPYESADDLMEHFNKAEMTHTIPYLNMGSFYKVHNDVKLYPSWLHPFTEGLIGYVKTDASVQPKENSYSPFAINSSSLIVRSNEEEMYSSNPGKNVVEKIKKMFPKITVLKEGDEDSPYKVLNEDLRVECFYPNKDIHPLLFKYFLYTDPIMKSFFFLDERAKVSRKKNYLYIFYYPDTASDDRNPITINLSNVLATDAIARQKGLAANRCHIRAYLSYGNRQTIDAALLDLNRCLSRFQEVRGTIEKELEKVVSLQKLNEDYLKSCPVIVKGDQDEVIEFNKLFPEYSRQFSYAPTPKKNINPKEYYLVNPLQSPQPELWQDQAPYEKKDKRLQAIYFPSVADRERLRKAGTFVNSYYFVADSGKDYDYIGLTDKDELDPPFIPNSYLENQMLKNKSGLDCYVNNKVCETSVSSGYILTTGKHIQHNKIGEMMEEVQKWMRMTFPTLKLYRYGWFNYKDSSDDVEFTIPKSKRASGILYVLEYLINGVKPNRVSNTIRNKLLPLVNTSTRYYTESFQYSKNELIDILLDDMKWIDPRLFYHMLRDLYKTELVFFTKDEERSKSPFYLTCPYFYHEYPAEPIERYDRFVMITINNGGEFDPHDYPRCEPMFIFNEMETGKKVEITASYNPKPDAFIYSRDMPLYRSIESALAVMYGKHYEKLNFSTAPDAQTVDKLGRVSWLHFSNISISLMIPIHSINLPIKKGDGFSSDNKKVLEWMERENVLYEERRVNGLILGYYARKQTSTNILTFYIPVRHEKEESSLMVYHTYEKIARYVTEYVYYLFSTYVAENEIVLTEDNVMEHYKYFSTYHLIVREQKELYPIVGRVFTLKDNPYLIENSQLKPPYQLWMNSEKLKLKAMYLLRQYYQTRKEELMVYHQLKYMPNYFRTTIDFLSYPRTLVLDNKTSVELYIQQNHIDMDKGVLEVKIDATEPYMLYRLLEEWRHSVFFIVPVDSLGKAIYITEQWTQKKMLTSEPREAELPHTKIVWTTPTSYLIYPEEGGERRMIFIMSDGTKTIYQACLPYDVKWVK